MNILKTGPRFIRGYIETKKFTSIKKQAESLRVAGDLRGEKDLIWAAQKRWVETMSPVLGLTYDVHGEENVPSLEDGPFMIYSNHQSFADICKMPLIIRTSTDYSHILIQIFILLAL